MFQLGSKLKQILSDTEYPNFTIKKQKHILWAKPTGLHPKLSANYVKNIKLLNVPTNRHNFILLSPKFESVVLYIPDDHLHKLENIVKNALLFTLQSSYIFNNGTFEIVERKQDNICLLDEGRRPSMYIIYSFALLIEGSMRKDPHMDGLHSWSSFVEFVDRGESDVKKKEREEERNKENRDFEPIWESFILESDKRKKAGYVNCKGCSKSLMPEELTVCEVCKKSICIKCHIDSKCDKSCEMCKRKFTCGENSMKGCDGCGDFICYKCQDDCTDDYCDSDSDDSNNNNNNNYSDVSNKGNNDNKPCHRPENACSKCAVGRTGVNFCCHSYSYKCGRNVCNKCSTKCSVCSCRMCKNCVSSCSGCKVSLVICQTCSKNNYGCIYCCDDWCDSCYDKHYCVNLFKVTTEYSENHLYRCEIFNKDVTLYHDKGIYQYKEAGLCKSVRIFLTINGDDYFIGGRSYSVHFFVNLKTGVIYEDIIQKQKEEKYKCDGFFWTDEVKLSPDGKTLVVVGCYWGGWYEYKLYDISDLKNGWNEINTGPIETIYDEDYENEEEGVDFFPYGDISHVEFVSNNVLQLYMYSLETKKMEKYKIIEF